MVAPPSPPSRRWRWLLAAVLIATLAVAGWRDVQVRRAQDVREQMVASAREGLLALTTIDHRQVDSDVQRILDTSTGGFREDFDAKAASFKDAARKAQSTSVGTVTEAAVESVDGDEGRVLVAMTVMTTNRGIPEQRPKAWRTRVSVTKVDEGFKVAAVEFVQ
jgi:Mce-associated membrane protein